MLHGLRKCIASLSFLMDDPGRQQAELQCSQCLGLGCPLCAGVVLIMAVNIEEATIYCMCGNVAGARLCNGKRSGFASERPLRNAC